MTTIAKMLNEKKVQLLLLSIVSVLVYLNSLPNTLVWDDHLFIEKWPEIRSINHLPALLKGSAPPEQGKIYRPIRSLVYLVDYSLWGENPLGYRIQAILIHLAATLLVYGIAGILLKQRNWAFITALLFAVHPIHTETIDYISASLETVGTVFFFASFYLYIKGNSSKFKVKNSKLPSKGQSLLNLKRWHFISIGFAYLAFFSYEMTLTLPLLLIVYEVCFNRKKSLSQKIANSRLYWLGAIIYLFVRTAMLGLISRTEYLGYSFYHTMLTMVKVFVRYIGLLIAPVNLTANHMLVGDFPSSMLPYDRLDPILNQSLFDLDVLVAITIILSLMLMAIRMLKKQPLISFSIFWFFISLLPVSYIIPHGGAMAEKYLYIASFGFTLFFVAIILATKAHLESKVWSQPSLVKRHSHFFKYAKIFFLLTIITIYSFLTIQRNSVWKNDITLFTDMANKSPQGNNLLANYNLGILYAEKKDYQRAIYHYQKALAKAPNFWQARFNLANIYFRQKKYQQAAQQYQQVLLYNPNFAPAKQKLQELEAMN